MIQKQGSTNCLQQPQVNPSLTGSNPKRDYEAHTITILNQDCLTENTPNEQQTPLRKKHQHFITSLWTTQIYENSNNSESKNQNVKQKDIEKLSLKNSFILFTQEEQSSGFTETIYYENQTERFSSNHFHHIRTQAQQIQNQQKVAQKIHLESGCKPNSSQSDDDSQNEDLALFIPFQKTQQEIQAEKSKQHQLIKAYTPLKECQILPWMNEKIKSIQDIIIRLHEEIRSFYLYLKPSKEQHQIRIQIFQSIKCIILSIYPQAKVFPFGSFATGLYLPDGDIDIVVLIQHQTSKHEQIKQFYKRIYQEFLQKHRPTYCKITYISAAKTPLIKMYDRKTGFSIDISLNKTSGLKQIEEVNKMKKTYPEFKCLVFVLKVLLEITHNNETFSGGIGSFLLICMVFHFLREFHNLARLHETRMVGLGEILLKFFRFYFINVDFFKQTIHVKSGIVTSRPRKRNSISMLSPFDEESDIGKKAWKMKDILMMFKIRYKIITGKHFEPGESILKQLINPLMEEFYYYNSKKQNFQLDEPQNDFMEDFSNNLMTEISTIVKKENVISPEEKQKKIKHRKYYTVDRKKTLQKNEKNQEDKSSEDGGLDSVSY